MTLAAHQQLSVFAVTQAQGRGFKIPRAVHCNRSGGLRRIWGAHASSSPPNAVRGGLKITLLPQGIVSARTFLQGIDFLRES
jgi:hypothetical protein